jgi:hypothetical protein
VRILAISPAAALPGFSIPWPVFILRVAYFGQYPVLACFDP